MAETRIGAGGRRGWALLVAGMCALGVLEALVLHLIGSNYLPSGVSLALDAVVAVLTVGFLIAVASPLWSSHRVRAGELRVRFGWLTTVNIALSLIQAVTPYRSTPQRPAELGLDFEEDSATLSAFRSPSSPLVRIELTEPVAARTQGLKRVRAKVIRISVDDAELLTEAIERASSGRDNRVDEL